LLAHALALLVAALPAPSGGAREVPVVLLTGDDRFGSGLVWSAPEGLVLTALHVVERMSEIQVVLGASPPVAARIVDRDPALDLALVQAEGPLGPALPVARADAAPARGDAVRLLGFPARCATAAEATVVDPGRRFAGARYVALAGAAAPGASGGPVVDARGAVIGIVDLVLAEREITLAIPIELALARFPRRAAEPSVARAGDSDPPASSPARPRG
jgi:S1-C subfamily serine protease